MSRSALALAAALVAATCAGPLPAQEILSGHGGRGTINSEQPPQPGGVSGQSSPVPSPGMQSGGGGGARAPGNPGAGTASAPGAGGVAGNMGTNAGRGGDGGDSATAAGGGGGGASCHRGTVSSWSSGESCIGGRGGDGGDGSLVGGGGGGGHGLEIVDASSHAIDIGGTLSGGEGGSGGFFPGWNPLHPLRHGGSGTGGAGLLLSGPITGLSFSGDASGGDGGARRALWPTSRNGLPGANGDSGGVIACSDGGAGRNGDSPQGNTVLMSIDAPGGAGIELVDASQLRIEGSATGGSGATTREIGVSGAAGGVGGRGGDGRDGDLGAGENGCRGGRGGNGGNGVSGLPGGAGGPGIALHAGTSTSNTGLLQGGVGGTGTRGMHGGAGAHGGFGGDGGFGTVGGATVRGDGGDGGRGGDGGNGGAGGAGGMGGNGVDMSGGATLHNLIEVGESVGIVLGGDGGRGGAGGSGGSAGAGGSGGETSTPASPGATGPAGHAGAHGAGGGSGNGGIGVHARSADTVLNTGFIRGGLGGAPVDGGDVAMIAAGGAGGAGVLASGSQIDNQSSIVGGYGTTAGRSSSERASEGRGGNGGDGVRAHDQTQIVLRGMRAPEGAAIQGGAGGDGLSGDGGGDHLAGHGGHGVVLDSGAILQALGEDADRLAQISGGDGGSGGSGHVYLDGDGDGPLLDVVVPISGGNGGDGGDALAMGAATSVTVNAFGRLRGGNGGHGGDADNQGMVVLGVSGGRGGHGGHALRMQPASLATTSVSAELRGGHGGDGGGCIIMSARGRGGSRGGDGGNAVRISGATFTHAGGAYGGDGGGFDTGCSAEHSAAGAGGAAIVLAGEAHVVFAGGALGGLSGDAAAVRAPAIALQDGRNVLELRTGALALGDVVSRSGSGLEGDELVLGGTELTGVLPLSDVGSAAKYRGFARLRKTGSGRWTLASGDSDFAGTTLIDAGTLIVDGNLASSAMTIDGGTLRGIGRTGALSNHATLAPGPLSTIGTLRAASYVQHDDRWLRVRASASGSSRLSVDGPATLDGVLDVEFNPAPVSGQQFTLLTADSIVGTFRTVLLSGFGFTVTGTIDYGIETPGTVRLTVVSVAPNPAVMDLATSRGTTFFQQAGAGPSTPVVVDDRLVIDGIGSIEGARVRLSGTRHAGDELAFANTDATIYGDIAAVFDATLGELSLASTGAGATRAQWQAALRAVTFGNTRQVPLQLDTAQRSIGFLLHANGAISPAATKPVAVSGATAPGPLAHGDLTADTRLDVVQLDGACSLREAVEIVNHGHVHPDCPVAAGSGAPRIALAPRDGAVFEFAMGETLVLATDVVIEAIGSDVVLAGDGAVRLVHVSSGVEVTMQGFAVRDGGAFALSNAGALVLRDMVLEQHASGAISNEGTLTIESSILRDNHGAIAAGIANHGTLHATSVQFLGNLHTALDNSGLATLSHSVFRDNASASDSGAIRNRAGALTLEDCEFDANRSNGRGGAIATSGGVVSVTRTRFESNTARGDGGFGGGAIFVGAASGGVVLRDSTLARNAAGGGSGGGGISAAGPLDVLNATFSGNVADGGGSAVLSTRASGVSRIVASTFHAPTATSTTLLSNAGPATLELKNSILRGADAGSHACNGTLTDLGGNLRWPAEDASCVGSAGDPRLAPLLVQGGATPTHLPLAGSAAVDSVVDCSDTAGAMLAADQRGLARSEGAACDAGAVEVRSRRLTMLADPGISARAAAMPEALVGSLHACADASCSARYALEPHAPVIELHATAATGTVAWIGDGCIDAGNGRASVLLDADRSCQATLATSTTHVLAYLAAANGALQGEATQVVRHASDGSPVTAIADAGYRFLRWSDGRLDNPRVDTNVVAALTVTAEFEILATDGLSIALDNGRTLSEPGDLATYVVRVRNAGPGPAMGVRVHDQLPASLQQVTWDCSGGPGVACLPSAGAGSLQAANLRIDLPPGATAVVRLVADVGAFTSRLDYTVQLEVPAGYPDADASDNTATDSDQRRRIFGDGLESPGMR